MERPARYSQRSWSTIGWSNEYCIQESKVRSSYKNNVIYYQRYFNNSVLKNTDSIASHYSLNPAEMYEMVREVEEDITKSYKLEM